MNIYYAGIGSRETPIHVLRKMSSLAKVFAKLGFILRSGKAIGADSAFEHGCIIANGKHELFTKRDSDGDWKAFELAESLHGKWDYLSPSSQSLHARNTYQILGKDHSSPVSFVVCWTPYGAETLHELRQRHNGGTATAIKLACLNNIPIFNLQKDDAEIRLQQFIDNTFLKKE